MRRIFAMIGFALVSTAALADPPTQIRTLQVLLGEGFKIVAASGANMVFVQRDTRAFRCQSGSDSQSFRCVPLR